MGDHTYGFEKLHVWQNARTLVLHVYNVTGSFPKTVSETGSSFAEV